MDALGKVRPFQQRESQGGGGRRHPEQHQGRPDVEKSIAQPCAPHLPLEWISKARACTIRPLVVLQPLSGRCPCSAHLTLLFAAFLLHRHFLSLL